MKWLFLIPPFFYVYVVRDIPTLFNEQDLMRGIAAIILVAALGIFFTGYIQLAKREDRTIKKLGNDTYDWIQNQ